MRTRQFRNDRRNVRGVEVGSRQSGKDDGEDDGGFHGCLRSGTGDSRGILDAEV